MWATAPLGIVKGPPGLKGGTVTLEGPRGSDFPTLKLGEAFNLDLDKVVDKDKPGRQFGKNQPFSSTGIYIYLYKHLRFEGFHENGFVLLVFSVN